MCPSVSKAEALRSIVKSAERDELSELAAELARGLAEVLGRSAAPIAPATVAMTGDRPGDLLTVDEAAERLGVAKGWLYRHAKSLPFTRKLGYRTIRFDALALDRWSCSRHL
jgi:excisionase family DNA binding protein